MSRSACAAGKLASRGKRRASSPAAAATAATAERQRKTRRRETAIGAEVAEELAVRGGSGWGRGIGVGSGLCSNL